MAKKEEKNTINPMTGEKLLRTKDILVYGITDDEFAVVVDMFLIESEGKKFFIQAIFVHTVLEAKDYFQHSQDM